MRKIDQRGRLLVATLFSLLLLPAVPLHAASPDAVAAQSVRVGLPGHVLPTLSKATQLPTTSAKLLKRGAEPLTLTVVLRRSDPYGFERYLTDVYDPQSDQYRKFLTPGEIADRFGPTKQDYDAVLAYFAQQGFTLAEGSANRMTLTLNGTPAQAESALAVRINNYKNGKKVFYANDRDPSLPVELAPRIEAVAGLSDFGAPQPNHEVLKNVCEQLKDEVNNVFPVNVAFATTTSLFNIAGGFALVLDDLLFIDALALVCFPGMVGEYAGTMYTNGNPKSTVLISGGILVKQLEASRQLTPKSSLLGYATGAGQRIGLVEFDTFQPSDVSNFLALTSRITSHPPSIANLSSVHVNGGATLGSGESEVLVDIDTVMAIAPHAQVVVYDAPASTSYQAVFNAMINGGVTIISNSWASCEDQMSQAEVQSIDTILATASASGISVFNGTGDTGSTCLDGSPNTVAVPADSPHATAVGGSSRIWKSGFVYGSETWWDGSSASPPSGQGGFGVSRYFSRPAYQDGFNLAAMRSVPDVVDNADPRTGMSICQADNGGCPTGALIGGTSMSAPAWAGYTALLNQAVGSNLGALNLTLYPFANTKAFNNAVSMGSDFAHVGLGSPNPSFLKQELLQQVTGQASTSGSWVMPLFPIGLLRSGKFTVPADGATPGGVRVTLWDASGNLVPGKTISLAASPGSHAIVTPVSAVTSAAEGSAIFTITDLTAETVTFTATDTTDNLVLQQTASITFSVPPATSAGITASPTTVASDGTSTTTITITLKDALNRPTPGKAITISQGSGHSIITGPSPAVTDANGQIQFTATDNVAETVNYTAVDVTDGNLPVPGSASVTYTGAGSSCVTSPPTAAAGFTLTPFASGFMAQNFFYSGVSWGGCPGASNPAFDTASNVFVSDFFDGKLYKLQSSGGAVSSGNTLATIGQALQQPAFGKDGSFYVARGATGSGVSSGSVLKIDPNTGAVLATLVTGLSCPSPISVDPLSGDLFFTDTCFGFGNNPSLWRIQNPASASPTLVVYATLPTTPNGTIAFAPNGTIYVVTNYNGTGSIVQVAGTNTSSPPAMTTLSGLSSDFWMTMGEVQANGAAKSLLVHNNNALKLVDITTNPFTTTVLANGSLGSGTIGPDGCLYAEASDTIFKLAPSSGGCGFAPTNPSPTLALTPATVVPNPAQGTSQTFTATFKNVTAPTGTAVYFQVSGANLQVKLGTTDANGIATISYTGVFAGSDTVVASGTVGNSTLTSNVAQLTWANGKHVAFLTLNLSPFAGAAGNPVTVVASLVDVSVNPNAPIAGATIVFTLGNQTCSGTTNAQGTATCTMTVPSTAGLTLAASFAGNAQDMPAADSERFFVVAAALTPPGAPTIGTATAGNGQASVSFTAPASDGGSPITSYTVACTPVGGGAAVTATGTGSPIIVTGLMSGTTYTCTVSAINAVGTGPASGVSNAVTPAAVTAVSTPIPTLSELALIILATLLGLFAMGAIRRRD